VLDGIKRPYNVFAKFFPTAVDSDERVEVSHMSF
jgi:hypothetical protein